MKTERNSTDERPAWNMFMNSCAALAIVFACAVGGATLAEDHPETVEALKQKAEGAGLRDARAYVSELPGKIQQSILNLVRD